MLWLKRFADLFPLWLLLCTALAFYQPEAFEWVSSDIISIALGIIMLMMGLTLNASDFTAVLKMPSWIITGLVLQYTIMPLSGFLISYLFQLPPFLALGLILVACCPGGTASNVITYLAGGNVALSVSMTSISTAMAVFTTPLLTVLLADSKIDIPASGLLLSTVKVILLPVISGVLLQQYLPKITSKIIPFSPAFSVLLIVIIVSSIMGKGKDNILEAGFSLLGAVVLLHVSGFSFGYILSHFLFRNRSVSRTISIEVGMQNSGLGVVLARQNISDPAAAIPAALSSLTHSILGSLLAYFWKKQPTELMEISESIELP
jgi:BASS family bile acid:Na+ symporter